MEGGGPFIWRKSLVNSCPFDVGPAVNSGNFKTEIDPNGTMTAEDIKVLFKDTCLNPSLQKPQTNTPTWICDDSCVQVTHNSHNGQFVKDQMLSVDMGLYYDFTTDTNTSRVEGYAEDGSVSCPGKNSQVIFNIFSLQS